MAALIKSALVKQISKFLKNVTPNQINISTLKGEGEMKNIQLDENVLMDLLELPTWLKISNAKCNKANVKVPWTKLKTNPIIIFLDKIEVDVEIADPLREYSTSNASKMFDKDSTGAYGFIDKCIDAIQLNIDSVTITIKSKTFNATLNMSNICVYSATPNWKMTNDIRNTRLKDLEKEEIILFKEISWEICRLEAFTIETGSQNQSTTSIKLIMNPSKVQIVLKKKLSDKSLINSTMRILLNEIYWMASDTQLKAAIGTYKTLSKLMTKSFNQKKKFIHIQQLQQASQNKQNQSKFFNSSDKSSNEILSKVFLQYDIKETSLHLQISNLNIHLYADDNYSGNKHIDGGSMQFLFKNICIDHYPYHKVGSSTKHWNNYNHIFRQREEWSKNLFNEFVAKLEEILNKSNIKDISQIRLKNNINLLESCTILSLKDFCIYKVTTNLSNKQANASSMRSKKSNQEISNQASTTYTSINDFLKMKDYFIEQQMYNMRPFLSSNSTEFNLPSDTLFANCFFSDFYFPEDINYPVPSSQIFVQVSPILLNIDFLTLLWINTLAFSLWREKLIVEQNEKSEKFKDDLLNVRNSLHCDTYLEVILPKVSLSIYPIKLNPNTNFENKNFQERPNSLEIGIAKLVITNQTVTKSNKNFTNFESASQKSYNIASKLIEKNSNFKTNVKKLNTEYDIKINNLAPCFNEILKNENVSFMRFDVSSEQDLINTTSEAINSKLGLFLKSLNKNALNKNASKDVWTVDIESLWIDMIDKENLPFVQNLSFKIFVVNVWDFLSKNFTHTEDSIDEYNWSNKTEFGFKEAYKRLEKIIQIQNIQEIQYEDKFRKRSNSLSNTTKLVHFQNKSNNICKNMYSSLNIITEIKNLSVYVNHSQILFLLRLVDVIDTFTKQIQIDTEQTLKFKGHSNKDVLIEKQNNKSLKLEDLFQENSENSNHEASVNFVLIANNVEIDLSINDMRKDIRFEPSMKVVEDEDQNSKKVLIGPVNNDETKMEKSGENSNYKEEFDIIVKQLDKEIISGYVKYVYGLSNDNPNMGLVFSSVPSSKDFTYKELNASVDSGFVSNEKTNLSSSFSTKTFSAGITKLASKITEPNESDLFVDDNDNMSVILSLVQDDTSSLISSDTQNLVENAKISPSRSSSASEVGSISASYNQLNKQSEYDQKRSLSINSNISRTVSTNNQNIQTEFAHTKVKLKIKDLNLYVQTKQENLIALIDFETIQIRDRKLNCLDKNKIQDSLIRFIKNQNYNETVNGLAEVYLNNQQIEIDIPTLVGMLDMIDDNDDFCKEIKETLCFTVHIKDFAIKLNDDPFNSYENNPKILDVLVEYLVINKTPSNRLIINEIKLGNNLDSEKLRLKFSKRINQEYKFVQESKSDMSCVQFTSKSNFKIDSDKFASLVVMLRKEKEENYLLKNKIEKEKQNFKSNENKYKSKIESIEDENNQLKIEIERLKNLNLQNIKNEVKDTNGFVLTDKNEEENLSQKLEIERKQFESLLLGYQEENELLKSKLRKTEEYVSLLNIERECLMKKLSQSKF